MPEPAHTSPSSVTRGVILSLGENRVTMVAHDVTPQQAGRLIRRLRARERCVRYFPVATATAISAITALNESGLIDLL